MSHTHDDGNAGPLAIKLFNDMTDGVTIPSAPSFEDEKYTFSTDDSNPLYSLPKDISLDELTDTRVDGDGIFDKMMKAVSAHLAKEFKGNRITGDKYAEIYSASINAIMGNATSFVLQKDQAKWAAIQAQMNARLAEIEATKGLIDLEKAKFETVQAQFDMNLTAAQFGLTKLQMSSEDAKHCAIRSDNALKDYELKYAMPADVAIKQYERTAVMPSTVAMNNVQVDRILPAQAAISEFQNSRLQPIEEAINIINRDRIMPAQADKAEFEVERLLPLELQQTQHVVNIRQPRESELIQEQIEVQRAQTLDNRTDNLTPIGGVIGLQKAGLLVDNDTKTYVLGNQLPKQVELVGEQIDLTVEQKESERAKTLDTRTDGATVEGSVGKQKDLYDQQIDSFIKDAKHKTAKMYLDGWITQKTLDEGLNAPTQLTNNEINAVMAGVRSANNL